MLKAAIAKITIAATTSTRLNPAARSQLDRRATLRLSRENTGNSEFLWPDKADVVL
jgi:hypothetical protein